MGGPLTLAGDVGGTKAYLGIFHAQDAGVACVAEDRFVTAEFAGVAELLQTFLDDCGQRPERIVIGVPGPVRHTPVKPVNLPWTIDPPEIAARLGVSDVQLLNDLQATAYGTLALPRDSLVELNRGVPDDEGSIAVIAAGTGLGEGGLVWAGDRYVALASEGGHSSFAPGTDQESELWNYLYSRFGHVSWERVVSGPGLTHIYEFLRESDGGDEPEWLVEELATGIDQPGTISRAATEEVELAVRAMDLFVSLYGAEAGNLALQGVAVGGVFIGGGVAPKILPARQSGRFMEAFTDKGRFAGMLKGLEVSVALDPRTPLRGAARIASQL